MSDFELKNENSTFLSIKNFTLCYFGPTIQNVGNASFFFLQKSGSVSLLSIYQRLHAEIH